MISRYGSGRVSSAEFCIVHEHAECVCAVRKIKSIVNILLERKCKNHTVSNLFPNWVYSGYATRITHAVTKIALCVAALS